MSSTRTIKPEQFEKAVLEAIVKYGDAATEEIEAVMKETSRATVKELKGSAPSGGRYAKGWSHRFKKGGASKLSDTVYNRTDYQLTHLLEKPHPTGEGDNAGHYPTHVNYTGTIADVEEKFSNLYMEEVLRRL